MSPVPCARITRSAQFSFALVLFVAMVMQLGLTRVAEAQLSLVTTIVLEDQAVPGTTFGTFQSIQRSHVNDLGQVVFASSVQDGEGADSGVFIGNGTSLTAVVFEGAAAPGTGGGTFDGFEVPTINASGDVAFIGSVAGGTSTRGIFLASGGSVTEIVLEGDAAPGAGTIGFIDDDIALSDSGEVVFRSDLSGTSSSGGIFGMDGTTSRTIALEGDPAPANVTGTYFILGSPTVNGAGDVAFQASFLGATLFGIVVDPVGPALPTVVAGSGDAVVGTTGTLLLFDTRAPALNAGGEVSFQAGLSGVPGGAHFVTSGGTIQIAALTGDVGPNTGGGTFISMLLNNSIDDAENVGFRAQLTGGTAGAGVFLSTGAGLDSIAVAGESPPSPAGSTYFGFPHPPEQSPSGLITYYADLNGGSVGQGIYLLPEPAGTLMLSVGIAALCALRRHGGRRAS